MAKKARRKGHTGIPGDIATPKTDPRPATDQVLRPLAERYTPIQAGDDSPWGAEHRRACTLCGEPFEGMGHNPQPLAEPPARCCDACNRAKVIPARLGLAGRGMNPYVPDVDPAWQADVAQAAAERTEPAEVVDLFRRVVTAEGEDLATSQATPGERMAARAAAHQADLPGAEHPGAQRVPQQLTDALGNVYTPGDGSERTAVADVLAAERYADLAAEATDPGYRGGGELGAAGPPPTSYSGTTAPRGCGAADVADLRNWMVRQWQPGGLYYRASTRNGRGAAATDFVEGERRQLQRAALYWTAPAMVDLLTTVAPSTPDDVRPVDLVWPDTTGLVVFATPVQGVDSLEGRSGLQAIDAEMAGEHHPVQVDAICWASTRIPDAEAPGGKVNCLSVSSYRLLDFDAGLGAGDLGLAVGSGAIVGARTSNIGTVATGPHTGSPTASLHGTIWAPLGRSDWPLLHPLGHQDSWIPDGAWPSFREDRQLVAALFTLLSDRQVLLADQHPAPVERQHRRRTEREAAKLGVTPRNVVVVTLRQPKRQAATPAEPGASGRTYSHQWYVKATIGWRWCGPGKTERRLVPIRGHVKGPEGAPFIAKTRVNAWVK